MKIQLKALWGVALSLSLVTGSALAQLSASDVARLGKDLTPMGAELAGNADGSIPKWTGGLKNAPAVASNGTHPNPFAGDKILFTITAQNMGQYKDKLSPGQMALLKKYPTHKMNIYPTQRSAVYPQFVYDNIKKYATSAKLVGGGYGMTDIGESTTPFPIPKAALEVMWNHLARFRGNTVRRTFVQIPVQANGAFNPNGYDERLMFHLVIPDAVKKNMLLMFFQEFTSPPTLEGNVLLVHEPIDQVKQVRGAWKYNAGQRRVRRAPQVAYDGTPEASDGLRTYDTTDMYNGAPDRYDWKLVGKQELYIAYNAYLLDDKKLSYKDIIQTGHINPDLARYELHRVWVVEATLKAGQRHVYAKRVFYIDEDSWQVAVVDVYDGRGELWRVSESHIMVYYELPAPWYRAEIHHDLQNGRYLAYGLNVEINKPWEFGVPLKEKDFTPSALRRAGKR